MPRSLNVLAGAMLALILNEADSRNSRCLAQEPKDSQSTDARLAKLLQRFPQADANGDGRLTAEEVAAYRKSQRQSRGAEEAERIAPTHADVAYGSEERQVLDYYQADSNSPTPLIVYIHGGGFVGGDKRSVHQGLLAEALDSGISVAALHYRFVDGEEVLFPVPQLDCARALKFLRSKAQAWNIDADRVACFGGSAGAGISMWLGFHDDLADPQAEELLARYSTRILAIGTLGGQGTYDPIEIKKLVGGRAWEHPSLVKVYGLDEPQQALEPSPELRRLYDEASAITHLTRDDPPLFMIYSEPDIVPPADSRPGQFIHHPNFGKQLKARMDSLGIENVYVHTEDAAGRDLMLEMLDFFKEKFAAAGE